MEFSNITPQKSSRSFRLVSLVVCEHLPIHFGHISSVSYCITYSTGKDEGISVGATRELVHRLSCTAFDLTEEAQYLFMGTSEAILPTLDTNGR